MWKNRTVSVILPTYNERGSIKKVIREFEALGIMDEIVVVNNNAAPGTSEEVAQTSAIEVFEPIPGYGSAIQRGFRETRANLIFVCEPDDTFLVRDVYKYLSYIEDVEVVYGARTVKDFIWKGANMGRFLKWGNWAVAKLMELLYNTNHLSDVGCTFRLIRAEGLKKIQDGFRIKSNFFGPEMMLLSKWRGLSFIQIPVNYRERVGESAVTGHFHKALALGLQMIWLILTFRFRGYER